MEPLQNWHVTKTPPKLIKDETHKNGALQKRHTLPKNSQRLPYLPRTELSD